MIQLEHECALAKEYIDCLSGDKLDNYIMRIRKEREESLLKNFKIGYSYLKKNYIESALIYLDFFIKNEILDNVLFGLKWKEVIDWGHGMHTVTDYEIPDPTPEPDDGGWGECCCYICCCACGCVVVGEVCGCIDCHFC